MSDVFPGDGWWMASDGKWYAPQLHHDPAYRARYMSVEPDSEEAEEEEAVEDAADQPAEADPNEPVEEEAVVEEAGEPEPADEALDIGDDVPTAEEISWPDLPTAEFAPPAASGGQPAPKGSPAAEDSEPGIADADDDWVSHGPADAEASPESDKRAVSVAPPRPAVTEARPRFEPPSRPDSVTVGHDAHHTRAKLEVGRDTSRDMFVGSRVASGAVSVEANRRFPPVTTASGEGLSEIRIYREPAELVDRVIAVALFVSGLLMIVGTFLTWVSEPGRDVSGWDRGDGIATVLAGLLGAAAAGPIFVGFRHIVPKTVAIVCGLVGSVVVGLVGLDVVSDTSSAGTSLGLGFWVAFGASLVMIGAGIAERTSIN